MAKKYDTQKNDLTYWQNRQIEEMVRFAEQALEHLDRIEDLGKTFRTLLNTKIKRNTREEQDAAFQEFCECIVKNRKESAKHHHDFLKLTDFLIEYLKERTFRNIEGNVNRECFSILGKLPSITCAFFDEAIKPWHQGMYRDIPYTLEKNFSDNILYSALSFQSEYIKWLELKSQNSEDTHVFTLPENNPMEKHLTNAFKLLCFPDMFLSGCFEKFKLRECLTFVILKPKIKTTKEVTLSFTGNPFALFA